MPASTEQTVRQLVYSSDASLDAAFFFVAFAFLAVVFFAALVPLAAVVFFVAFFVAFLKSSFSSNHRRQLLQLTAQGLVQMLNRRHFDL